MWADLALPTWRHALPVLGVSIGGVSVGGFLPLRYESRECTHNSLEHGHGVRRSAHLGNLDKIGPAILIWCCLKLHFFHQLTKLTYEWCSLRWSVAQWSGPTRDERQCSPSVFSPLPPWAMEMVPRFFPPRDACMSLNREPRHCFQLDQGRRPASQSRSRIHIILSNQFVD